MTFRTFESCTCVLPPVMLMARNSSQLLDNLVTKLAFHAGWISYCCAIVIAISAQCAAGAPAQHRSYQNFHYDPDSMAIEWSDNESSTKDRITVDFAFFTPTVKSGWQHSCRAVPISEVDSRVFRRESHPDAMSLARTNKRTLWTVSVDEPSWQRFSGLFVRCTVYQNSSAVGKLTSEWKFSRAGSDLDSLHKNSLLVLIIVLPVVCLIMGVLVTSIVYQCHRHRAAPRVPRPNRHRSDTTESVIETRHFPDGPEHRRQEFGDSQYIGSDTNNESARLARPVCLGRPGQEDPPYDIVKDIR
uniref:Secreted protein n=1 Tax=Macrostomum lignano TaxID=282301 RepID=A0A1I8G2L3_9PLAT